jgi:hypothetical protein
MAKLILLEGKEFKLILPRGNCSMAKGTFLAKEHLGPVL